MNHPNKDESATGGLIGSDAILCGGVTDDCYKITKKQAKFL